MKISRPPMRQITATTVIDVVFTSHVNFAVCPGGDTMIVGTGPSMNVLSAMAVVMTTK